MQVRPFSTCDLAGMYRVCLLTGDSGADGTAFYRDPDLLGHVYAAPYPVADPGLTWVVTDEDGVAGYVVGAADSQGFARWQEEVWWPPLRERYPLRPEVEGLRDHDVLQTIHRGSRYEEELTADYPAHLHIDLVPEVQGGGRGGAMLRTLLDALAAAGASGAHLGVARSNERAIGFYTHLGFTPAEPYSGDDELVMVRSL